MTFHCPCYAAIASEGINLYHFTQMVTSRYTEIILTEVKAVFHYDLPNQCLVLQQTLIAKRPLTAHCLCCTANV